MRQKIQNSLLLGDIGEEHVVKPDYWVDRFDIFAFSKNFQKQIK
jgi:hypothetical protein